MIDIKFTSLQDALIYIEKFLGANVITKDEFISEYRSWVVSYLEDGEDFDLTYLSVEKNDKGEYWIRDADPCLSPSHPDYDGCSDMFTAFGCYLKSSKELLDENADWDDTVELLEQELEIILSKTYLIATYDCIS